MPADVIGKMELEPDVPKDYLVYKAEAYVLPKEQVRINVLTPLEEGLLIVEDAQYVAHLVLEINHTVRGPMMLEGEMPIIGVSSVSAAIDAIPDVRRKAVEMILEEMNKPQVLGPTGLPMNSQFKRRTK